MTKPSLIVRRLSDDGNLASSRGLRTRGCSCNHHTGRKTEQLIAVDWIIKLGFPNTNGVPPNVRRAVLVVPQSSIDMADHSSHNQPKIWRPWVSDGRKAQIQPEALSALERGILFDFLYFS